MKRILFTITLSASIVCLALGCSDNDFSAVDRLPENFDTGTVYFNIGESTKTDLYYKPRVGYVGDPMPFYDSKENDFKILYLQDMRNGNSVIYHPVYELKTKDAASYHGLGEAIACGGAQEDDPALGTGSTVEKDGVYYTFYTGHKTGSPREVILKASSTDGKSWKKDRSFRLQAPNGYNQDEFRDPYCFYDDEARLYRMVIAAIKDGKSVLAQFTSSDLTIWKETEPFFINKWGRFYECPDVFKMGNYWYLIYSDKDITRQVQYFFAPTLTQLMALGNDPAFPWRDEGKLEGTSFYAGKSASDGQKRYIWGWCATRQGNVPDGQMDWAGTLVAHKIVQNEDGTLGFSIPEAVDKKFVTGKDLREVSKSNGVEGNSATGYTIPAGQSVRFGRLNYVNKLSFTVKTTPGHSVFGLSFVDCNDRDYNYRVYVEDRWSNLKFDKVMTDKDGNESRQNINSFGLQPAADGVYNIKIVSDHSVCVVYINNQYAFTNRINGMALNPWSLFCSDGKVIISDLKWFTY